MKILIFANNDVGLYQFRKELINELLQENSVSISMPFGEFAEYFEQIGCQYILTEVDRRGLNPIKDLKLLRKYTKIVKQVKPDMVITYTIKPNIYGGMICRTKKIPYAINITGLGTIFQKKGVLQSLIVSLYKLCCKKARVVFFENCENQQLFIDKKIVTREKTCLLNGAGVNLNTYSLMDYPKENTATQFLFMGRVMKEKGIEELLLAGERLFSEGYNFIINVLGYFEEDVYCEKIKQCEDAGWLKYYGQQRDVRPFIQKSHCFVLPSWHEGMANTNLECAASGRPVITSNIHGCLEAVEDGVTGFLCERKNAESLAEKMRNFCNLSWEEQRQMGQAGRKLMERRFDKKIVVKNTISALRINCKDC